MADVYLVPVGAARHELYCEVPDEIEGEQQPVTDAAEAPGFFRGLMDPIYRFFRGLRDQFNAMLAEAERNRRQGVSISSDTGWFAWVKARSMRWVAESIAEQRLLWHLRSQTHACLVYPDDLDEGAALAAMRASLKRDYDKHRYWLVIDGLLFVASGALALVPGPNVLAYYFAFRVVGHYLSFRGAGRGLSEIEWTTEKSEALSELRRVINLAPDAREQRVHEVAGRLRLEHLASFFQRSAIPMS